LFEAWAKRRQALPPQELELAANPLSFFLKNHKRLKYMKILTLAQLLQSTG